MDKCHFTEGATVTHTVCAHGLFHCKGYLLNGNGLRRVTRRALWKHMLQLLNLVAVRAHKKSSDNVYRTDTISDQADNCRLAGFPEDCVQVVDSANADASVDWQNHPALVADESLELVGLGFHKCSDEKVYWTVIATGSDDSAEESKMPDLNTGTPRYAQHCPCIVELSFGSDSLLQRPKLSNYGVYPLYPPTVASPSHLCPCQTSHHSADKRVGDRPPPRLQNRVQGR